MFTDVFLSIELEPQIRILRTENIYFFLKIINEVWRLRWSKIAFEGKQRLFYWSARTFKKISEIRYTIWRHGKEKRMEKEHLLKDIGKASFSLHYRL